MAKVELHTGPGIFEVLASVCRNPQEALKQFVENAADAIEQAKVIVGTVILLERARQFVKHHGFELVPDLDKALHDLGYAVDVNSILFFRSHYFPS